MKAVSQIASWCSTIVVARLLTPSDYGLVAVSGIFVGFALKFAGMGLGAALINKESVTANETSNLFWLATLLAVVMYSILFFSAPYISVQWDMPELKNVIRVAGTLIILGALSMVSRALLMRALAFKITAIVTAFANFLVTVSAIALAYGGYGYWSLIYSTVLGEILMVFCFCYFARFRLSLPVRSAPIVSYCRYGINILLSRLLDYLNAQWPVIISGQVLGKISTGYFQMAYTIAALPLTKIGELFYKVIFPSFSRLQGDKTRACSVFLKIHRYLMFITMPMFIGIFAVADQLVPVALGEKWVPIIVPVKILSIINLFMISAQVLPRVLEGIGNSRANVMFQGICALIFPIVMYLGVQGGLNMMLLSFMAAIPLCYSYLVYVAAKELSFSLFQFFETMLYSLIAGCVMLAACFAVGEVLSFSNVFIVLVAKILTGAMVYFLCYYMLRPNDVKEIIMLAKRRSS